MSAKTWFEVDKEGLAKLLERKGKEFVLYELIQNAWDTNAKFVDARLSADNSLRGYAEIEVLDDHPEGWKDLTHAWTLYAESEKKGNAEKRGRFNLGEKLVLALCKIARIETTTGGVLFDVEGRHTLRSKREKGSRFHGFLRMNEEERAAAGLMVMRLLPPENVQTTFNGEIIPYRKPLRVIDCTLPTELADAEGVLRRTARKTKIEVYETKPGETSSIYELGIPVVEIGGEGRDPWHVNVTQKVPLNADRDNVTPAYLREIRTLVLNAMYQEVRQEEATAPWVRDAAEDEDVSKEAMEHVITERFGEKRVIFDPSDQEGTKIAVSQGYTVMPPGALSKQEWANVKRFEVALPAGQVTPSPKPYAPDGEQQKILDPAKWTPGIRKVATYAAYIAKEVLGAHITVKIVTDIGWPYAATFGRGGDLTLNLGRLGHAWFDHRRWRDIEELIVHEFGHWYAADHLSEEYHKALCRVASGLLDLALRDPEKMKELRS